MATVSLSGVGKSYGTQSVVRDINLEIADGEFIVLVGPSGCGKSTILRMIAGLEDITLGEVCIGGEVVNEMEARERKLAMVFQDYALYPHMSVEANIGFGLKMNGVPPLERSTRVREVARLLQLEPYLERKPRALSGGQRQRVAMGRALARKAQLFLFDEPLSNLDAQLRMEVRTQIKLLHRDLGMTSVFVTHDQTEAMTLADRIVCLEGGSIAQVGTPDDLYTRPANVFVASFIGSPQINLLPATVVGGALRLADGQLITPIEPISLPEGKAVIAGFRPEDLTDEVRVSAMSRPQPLRFDYIVPETLGSDTYLIGDIAGNRVTARCAPGTRPPSGSQITLHADAARLHLFDPETRKRI
ncbi:MAG: sn-glycerol-3-phosphate ABC transporter ATP-binding protein UgpC [Hyphomicrobiales bacterium]|nr:sn-glycerol-3-phosphate ABC transporter ATP-binding protein UgpC [Hyphomicrobiales bacterium]